MLNNVSKFQRKAIFWSLIVALIAWAVVLPFLLQKRSNESLDDITKSAPANNSTQPQQPTGSPEPQTDPTSQPQLETIAQGTFKGLNGQSASGSVKLIKSGDKYFVRLEDDFSVSSGPDLFVATGNGNKVLEQFANLKGNSGGQNYELPSSVDPAQLKQIIIHCRAFAYSFGVADLQKI